MAKLRKLKSHTGEVVMHSVLDSLVNTFSGRSASSRWSGKKVGKDVRLLWSDATFLLEELPQKGKKTLLRSEMQNPFFISRSSGVLPDNVIDAAGLSSSDNIGAMKEKILKAMKAGAAADVEAGKAKDFILKNIEWYDTDVFYLNVIPEGIHPFQVKAKDFTVQLDWTEWKAYSPSSYPEDDPNSHNGDPHYTYYSSTSPTSARKMYNILSADEGALKSIPWAKFGDWLNKNKVKFETHFSTW